MSKRVVIELTNRCNLSCEHCFSGRHGGSDDLPLQVLQRVLDEARDHGFTHLSFTGGDPTVHARFPEVVRLTSEAGYRYSFVTNGWNFTTVWPRVRQHRQGLSVVTFSLDGATEQTHDSLRGAGSFRRAMKAATLAMVEEVPFSVNMVVTAHNRHELADMVDLAASLGARGVRFGHLMPAPLTTARGFDLSPAERKAVEAQVHELRRTAAIPIGVAPGFYTTDLFPCAPLQLQELNIDCRGNLSKCCHLSGHGPGVGSDDVMGNLAEITFGEALALLAEENRQFHESKRRRLAEGRLADTDYFTCWDCSLHYRKVDWLKRVRGNPWAELARARDGVAKAATVGAGE